MAGGLNADAKIGDIPFNQAGMFDMVSKIAIRQITDGTSNTIAMGEASNDPRWQICEGFGCTNDPPGQIVESAGHPPHPWDSWIIGTPPLDGRSELRGASIFACTLEPINKSIVTETQVALADLSSSTCLSNFPGSTPGGSTTSNFRSDHPGGANFLLGDGSVHFLSESIDPISYRALSTISGDEVVGDF